jgi:MFS transporter, FSR family, fosmidomycin resistance protein
MKRSRILLLTFSHFAADVNQGALPALLPILVLQRHFSYSLAASLVLAANAMASFLQPLFGTLADRKPMPALAPLGLLVASGGMALAGIAQSYPLLLVAVALSGMGLAVFHPEAARLVHQNSGGKRSSALSLFAVGGNAGFAAGPILTTAVLAKFGLHGSLFLLVPSLVMGPIILAKFRNDKASSHPSRSDGAPGTVSQRKDTWGPFALLTAAIIFRSIVFYGLNTFLPLYWIGFFGKTKADGSFALSLLLVAGAMGTLVGGPLGDRFPRPLVIRSTMSTVPFLLWLFVLVTRPGGAMTMLPVIGFILFMPFSIMVVLGQEYLPNHLGTASGVTLGLAGSIGGLAAPALGAIADRYGIHTTLVAIAAVAIVAAVLTWFLKPAPDIDQTDALEQIDRTALAK